MTANLILLAIVVGGPLALLVAVLVGVRHERSIRREEHRSRRLALQDGRNAAEVLRAPVYQPERVA